MDDRASQPIALGDLLRRRLADGGRPTDLLVRADGASWEVAAVVGGDGPRAARWDGDRLAAGGPVAAAGLVPLRGDVLDRQIVDAGGRRVTRIGDVALAPVDGRLEAVALEVGLRPVFRRLGLRRIARRHAEDLIAVDDVRVAESCVIARVEREHLAEIETHDLAALIRRLPHEMKHDVLDELPEDRSEEVRGHIARRPHRPRWRLWGTRHA